MEFLTTKRRGFLTSGMALIVMTTAFSVSFAQTQETPEPPPKPPEFKATARIESIPPVPNPRHNVYSSCVVLAEVTILKAEETHPLPKTVVVGFWGFKDRELMPAAEFSSGTVLELTMIPLAMASEEIRSVQRIGNDGDLEAPPMWAKRAVPVKSTRPCK